MKRVSGYALAALAAILASWAFAGCASDLDAQYNTGSDELHVPNLMPDIVSRVGFNAGTMFHLDAGGVFRVFRHTLKPYVDSVKQIGGGFTVNSRFAPARASALIGQIAIGDGIGRYIGGLIPDVSVSADGAIHFVFMDWRHIGEINAAGKEVYSELKNVILVDADVDIYDTDDVLWAMQTRMQGDLDIINIPGVSGHVLDPTQQPEYNPALPAKGVTTKTIFDATAPFRMPANSTP